MFLVWGIIFTETWSFLYYVLYTVSYFNSLFGILFQQGKGGSISLQLHTRWREKLRFPTWPLLISNSRGISSHCSASWDFWLYHGLYRHLGYLEVGFQHGSYCHHSEWPSLPASKDESTSSLFGFLLYLEGCCSASLYHDEARSLEFSFSLLWHEWEWDQRFSVVSGWRIVVIV